MIPKNKLVLWFLSILICVIVQSHYIFADIQEQIVNWLAEQQNDDGSWNSVTPFSNDVSEYVLKDTENDEGSTEKYYLNNSTGYVTKIACRFTPQDTYFCKKIKLPLSKTWGTYDNPEGSIYVYLCAEDNGEPSDSILASSNEILLGEGINDPMGDYKIDIEFVLTHKVQVNEGQTYYIVLAPGANGLHDDYDDQKKRIAWHYAIENSGNLLSCNDANVWSNAYPLNRYKLLFKVYSMNAVTHPVTRTLNSLVVTQKILDSNIDCSQMIDKAIAYIENQEFSNTEYLSRQIEILALSNRDCSVYVDKLLSWRNVDGGWGEYPGYKSNTLDTVWAMRALLATEDQNEAVLKNALELLISYTNKLDETDTTDRFRWSTFYPTYCSSDCSLQPRTTSSIVSAYILELLTIHYDFFEQLDTTGSNLVHLDQIISDLKTYLNNRLSIYNSDIEEYMHEASIVARVLTECGESAATTISAITASLETENDLTHYKQDSYLTATILEALSAQPYDPIKFSISLVPPDSIEITFDDFTLVSSIEYYIKNEDADTFQFIKEDLFQTERLYAQCTYSFESGDTIKVIVNGACTQYQQFYDQDLAVFARDTRICFLDPDDNEYPLTSTTFEKTDAPSKMRIKQKIFNYTPVSHKVSIEYGYDQDDLQTSTVTVDSSDEQMKFFTFDLSDVPTDQTGLIQITIEIPDTCNSNHTATMDLHVVSGDGTTENPDLAAPLFPVAQIIGDEEVLLSWQAPLDPNVVAYKISGYGNPVVTNTTSAVCGIESSPETYCIYSLDKNNCLSQQWAEITVVIDDPPEINVTYPYDNAVITLLEDKDSYSNTVMHFDIQGTIDYYKDYYSPKIDITKRNDSDDYVVQLRPSTDQFIPEDGVIYRFCMDDFETANLVTGDYDMIIKLLYGTEGPVVIADETIPISIQKWEKAGLVGDNNSKTPSWDVSGTKIMFASDESFGSSSDTFSTQGSFQQLFDLTNFIDFSNIAFYEGTTPLIITPLTSSRENHLEPAWISHDTIMSVVHCGGNRTIVLKDNTGNETPVDIAVDSYGNQVAITSFDPTLHYKKSFYNPDCATFGEMASRCIVASDELGELVMLVENQLGGYDLHNLTRDFTAEQGKQFVLADNPSVAVDPYGMARILFEGYSLVPHSNFHHHDYYYNSDIYYLKFKIPQTPFLFGNTAIDSNSSIRSGGCVCAYGPYLCSDDGVLKSISFKIENNTGGVMVAALYTNITKSDGTPYPGTLLAQSSEVQISADGWIVLNFSETIHLDANDFFWVANCHTNNLDTANKDSNDFKVYYYSNAQSLSFQNTFPEIKLEYTPEDLHVYEADKEYPIAVSVDVETQLFKVTDTANESELSPVWLCDGQTDDFLDANVGFVQQKDFWGDGFEESTICVGALELNSPDCLTNIYPLARHGSFEGIVQNIDYRNYYFLYDELLYDGELAETSYRSRIGYMKLKSPIHTAFRICNDTQGEDPIYEQVTLVAGISKTIYILEEQDVTVSSTTFDNNIHDSAPPEPVQLGAFTTQFPVTYDYAGTYTAEFVFVLDSGLRYTRRFTVIVTED